MPDNNAPLLQKYGYSTDDEEYRGVFDSRSAAAWAAIDRIEASTGTLGLAFDFHTAEFIHPIDAMGQSWCEKRMGADVMDAINEWSADEVGGDEKALDITKEDELELGAMIVKFIRERAAVQRYGVAAIEKHTHIIGSEQ